MYLLSFVHTLPYAFLLMALVGICSGFFVVPLDALLQRQGEDGGGVGSAIAIQNFFEHLSMLALASGYAAVSFIGVPVNDVAVSFGLFLALSMGALTLMCPDNGQCRPAALAPESLAHTHAPIPSW